MKKTLRNILLVILFLIAGAWIYWQFNKKGIVKNAVENIVEKKSGDLYFIDYDSSYIDAAGGNARFYNVALQSDSLQKQLLEFDTSSASAIYNVNIGEVSVSGANIPALISNTKVEANSIRIIRPIIYIIQSGTKKEKPFNRQDTLAIYEKLLGKFNSIEAGEIVIQDGSIYFSNKTDPPHISLNKLNVTIKNVRIDSTKNYDNIISYFIKDVHASVDEVQVTDKENKSTLKFSDFDYNAQQRRITLSRFQQKNNESGNIVFDINKTEINGLNTDSFILIKQLKAEDLVTEGGLMTFYKKQGSKDKKDEAIEIDNNFFYDALLNKIKLGTTKVQIFDRARPKDPPFILSNVQFSASEIQNLYSGTNVRSLIGKSNWSASADGFSFITKDKIYKISIGAFDISHVTGVMNIQHFSVIPQVSGASFVKGLKVQKDLYDMTIKNIKLTGIDSKKLLADKMLIAETMSIQPEIKIFNDRTVPESPESKIGSAPHQLLQKADFKVYIKRMNVSKGLISYIERGRQSEQKGEVFFANLNGTIDNITNIDEFVRKNNMMVLNMNTQFLGISNLQTKWMLPLNTTNGAFTITGYMGPFSASSLNALIEPLALASVKNGQIKSLNFNIYGTDYEAKGVSKLLYNDLKIEALKKDSNDVKKRGVLSFLANLLIKDNNPQNNVTREGDINLERDKTRSFFNLLWKGIFSGIKRIAIGKDDDKK